MSETKWFEDRDTLAGCRVRVVMDDGTEVRGRMNEDGIIKLGNDQFWPLFPAEDEEWHYNYGVKDVSLLEEGKTACGE